MDPNVYKPNRPDVPPTAAPDRGRARPQPNPAAVPESPIPRPTGPGGAPNAPGAITAPSPTAPQPGYIPMTTGNGGSGRQSGTTTSAGRGSIPSGMPPTSAPAGRGEAFGPPSGGLPISPLGSIPGEQAQAAGNSPADFTPRAGESAQSAGERVRDAIRGVVRGNGGTPAENG